MNPYYEWHMPKDGRLLSKEESLLRSIFSSEEIRMVARCGEEVEERQLRTYDQYIDDKGANPGKWCPHCFGG